MSDGSSFRWWTGYVVVPLLAAVIAAGSFYWELLFKDGRTGSVQNSNDATADQTGGQGQPAGKKIVLDQHALAANVTHTLCRGRLAMKFNFRYQGTVPDQVIYLIEPHERSLASGDAFGDKGCDVTYLRSEPDGDAIFKITWTDSEH